MAILILHGPNLNLLGQRETKIYGDLTLDEINSKLISAGKDFGVEVRVLQSNHEGELIEALHQAQSWATGIVFNPAGYTHSSVALRDAIASINIPVIEVHISNVYAREPFRQVSLVSAVCAGKIVGLGWRSYLFALHALVKDN
ncbi:MAG: type II 3-dehydroquinate dehydratase [Anaerolineae bacterium]|nr:type II 3-dehydroquinate dehydratase [Anaerolineae bacterium]